MCRHIIAAVLCNLAQPGSAVNRLFTQSTTMRAQDAYEEASERALKTMRSQHVLER